MASKENDARAIAVPVDKHALQMREVVLCYVVPRSSMATKSLWFFLVKHV